jgi:N-acyl-D-aspartate/D-glutamate deacylase
MNKTFDILIKDGTVYDGSGSEPYTADIGIKGDRISLIVRRSAIGAHEECVTGRRTIHAKQLVVAPGFIDTHGHSEFALLADPRAEGKISQGITTEINGNCGLSAAPLFGEALKQREADLSEYGIRERWSTFSEYFALLKQRTPSVNYCTLTGHGNLRACAAGYEDRKLSESDLTMMRTLLTESIDEGSIGISTGLIYPPGIYADTEELIALCRVLNHVDPNGSCIYTSHMRSEGDRLIESIEETIRVAKESGIKVHISHLKTSGERNWHKIDHALSLIATARDEGYRVTGDRYPYTAASTDLDTVLPSWTYEGGAEEELRRLQNRETQFRIREEILSEHPEKGYWERIVVTSVISERNRWMEGKNVLHIASLENSDPVATVLRILIDEKLRVGAIFSSMSEENLRRILSLPYVMIGTDSLARSFDGLTCRGKPHPRGFGSFPRFLGRFAFDTLQMDVSEAIRKITLLPALTFGISDRGIIREGAYADITIFDSQRVLDRATYEEPFLRSEGIYYVIVNGVTAIWEGRYTGLRAGRILRNGKT